MIEESAADFLPIWMLLSAAFGFLIGDAFGDSTRHRKCLEQANDDLRDELDKARNAEQPLHRESNSSAASSTTSTRRSRLCQKASKKGLPKPSKINSRIAPIRLCQNV